MSNEEKKLDLTPESGEETATVAESTPEQAPEKAPETFQERVPSKKRTALLRYMTVMFAAAFVLVLMSFLLEAKKHDNTAVKYNSVVSKAEKLQEENRTLTEDLTSAREYVKLAREEGEKDVANTKTAYDALMKVLTTEEPKDGDVEYSKAVETVNNLQKYLSEDAVNLFEETMAQRTEDAAKNNR